MSKQDLSQRYAFAVESALEDLQKKARIINAIEIEDEDPTDIADLIEVLRHVERVEDVMKDVAKNLFDIASPKTVPTP